MLPKAPNWNRLWTDLLVEELVRCGVEWFVMAPGSRSAPLVTAVAANPRARTLVHVDERGAAFHALGVARASGRPAVWITTSGTAAANGLPAVVEASTDGVPMILVTADRPPELRDASANQAVDQASLFGRHVRWQFDLPAPGPDPDAAFVLTTADQAVYRAAGGHPGPVHLNCMFREPLAPDEGPGGPVEAGLSLGPWTDADAPWTRYAPDRTVSDCAELERALEGSERVLVVAGRLERDAARAVRRMAVRRGWPMLADVGSQLRLGPASADDPVIRYGDLLLADPAALTAPDAVLHVGRPGVSRRTAAWIDGVRPAVRAVVADTPIRIDPAHAATHRLRGVSEVCDRLARGRRVPDWAGAWREADRRAARALDERFSDGSLTEPSLAHHLARLFDPSHALFLASSMPVRDMDSFAGPGARPLVVAANRGASGIDGTVASAAGLSDGLGAPVTLVLGDLALLHDLNSLALLGTRPIVVVVVNNDGGGIFSFLGIARHEEILETWFAAPHGLRFEAAASMFGLGYAAPADVSTFAGSYRSACARGGSTLIEVRTDRRENHALHADLVGSIGR